MIDQLKYTKNNFMKQIQAWMIVLEPLYLRYVPLYLRRRRNIKEAKLTDVMVHTLMHYQVDIDITNQAKFHRFLKIIFSLNLLPEKSLFNQICNNEEAII